MKNDMAAVRAARLTEQNSVLLGCQSCGEQGGYIRVWVENPDNIEGWCQCGRKLYRVE